MIYSSYLSLLKSTSLCYCSHILNKFTQNMLNDFKKSGILTAQWKFILFLSNNPETTFCGDSGTWCYFL